MFVFALIGGIGFALFPYACIKALSAPGSERQPRWVLLTYGSLAAVALIASFAMMIIGGFWLGLGAAIVTAIATWVRHKQKTKVDFVVEGPLLGEALDEQARTALLEVTEEARKRHSDQG